MSLFFPASDDLSRHTIFPGVDIATCSCGHMMLSYVTMAAGAEVALHSHPHEQVGIVLEGKAIFYIGDEQKTMTKGDMYRIPGHVKHRVTALEGGLQALDVFHPIREDYR